MFVFVNDLYSESSKERSAYFNYKYGLTVETLIGSTRTWTVVGDNYVCVAGRVIYLHSMGSEASCNSFQGLFYFGEELVWRVGDDSDREVIKESWDG